ncbi:MAG: hypothetical protein IPJ14_22900 [Kineosporiaceae bacterium]|nr:hypothetical protein [Kineosporiaceae bacterium]
MSRQAVPGVVSPLANPGEIDFVVVREGTGGSVHRQRGAAGRYAARGRHRSQRQHRLRSRAGHPDAFARAGTDPGVTSPWCTSYNVLSFAGHLWRRTVERGRAGLPEVTTAYQHVDAATIFMVNDPTRFDVIVTDNLFGDIITDLAAATRRIGLRRPGTSTLTAVTVDVRAGARFGPDIAGQGKADPTATEMSVAMLLRPPGPADKGGPRGWSRR